MKKNSINWNHGAETLSEALGLNTEQRDDVHKRVQSIVKREETHSKAAAELIEVYEEDPAKQAYALLILESTEEGLAMSKVMDSLLEKAE